MTMPSSPEYINNKFIPLFSFLNQVESQIKGEAVAKDWDISSNYKFDIAENREVRLVLDSVEENIWRRGGRFTPENIEAISEMFAILRGKTKNDKEWHKADQQSLQEFIQSINQYENREKFLVECTFEKIFNRLTFPSRVRKERK